MTSERRAIALNAACSKIGSGATPRGGKESYKGGRTALIRSQNVYNEGFVRGGLVYISDEQASELRNVIVEPGDVLLNITGDSVARCCIVDSSILPARVNQHVAIVRAERDVLDARYLRYLLVQPLMQAHLLSLASAGATRNALTKGMLESLVIEVPPLPEQRAIAHVLGTLDDKVELNRKMSDTLEELARTLFKSWLVDFDPVHAKAAGKKPFGMDDATAALFPDSFEDSELGPIPRGWRVGTLGEVISELEVGKRPKGGVKGIDHGVPSIGAESIKRVGEFDFSKTKYVPLDFFEAMGRGYVQSRDVLLYKDGGRPGEFEPHVSMFGDGFPFERCCINEHVYRIRANEHYSQNLLYFALSSDATMHEMRMKGGGVAVPGLNSTAARSLLMTVPPSAIVRAFDDVVEPMIARILLCSKESRTLAELRDTLLPKLLSGELRVPLDVTDAPSAKSEQLGLFGDR